MALQIVYIGTESNATYFPTYPLVRPGDDVQFELVDRRDSVTVTFRTSSPFTQTTPLVLDGSSTTTAMQSRTVSNSVANNGRYEFDAVSNAPIRNPTDPERPGTVSGGLETTNDPPPVNPKR